MSMLISNCEQSGTVETITGYQYCSSVENFPIGRAKVISPLTVETLRYSYIGVRVRVVYPYT